MPHRTPACCAVLQGRAARRARGIATLLTALAGVGAPASAQPAATEGSAPASGEGRRAEAGAGAPAPAAPPAPGRAVAGASVSRSGLGMLEINVRDTEIATVLEMLAREARANIVTSVNVRGKISANLYGVTLAQALDAVLTPNNYAHVRLDNAVFVGTPAEVAAQLPPPQTRVFRLKYIARAEAAAAAAALLGASGRVLGTEDGGAAATGPGASGGSASEATRDAGVEYILVTAPKSQLDAVERLLGEIDVRPRQVLIEATILRATLTEGEELGIDFTMLSGVDFENVASTSNASADLTTGRTPPDRFQHTTSNVNTAFTGNVSPGGLSFGIIRNNFGVFLRALEEVTDVVVLANPKVLALNRQEAEVIVGRRDGYLTTTVTQTAAVQTVEFLETGTQVKIRPHINDDGTVRLRVHPKDSSGGLTSSNLPFEETTEAQADILVRDGHTVLIGGMFRERTVGSRSQVPVLGNVPVAGLLFQSHADRTIREEVIVLLTVHVLKETDEESTRFAELLDDVERIRIGSRLGLNGIGRERLAQAYYQEAVERAERGDDDLALLNVRMALHNQPRHVAALRLRDNLLKRRSWHGEGSRMRLFTLKLIEEAEAGSPRPPIFGRPRLDLDPDPPPAAPWAPDACEQQAPTDDGPGDEP